MKIDIIRIKEQMVKSLRRFPVCLVLLAAMTLQLMCYIFSHDKPDAWTFFFSVGMLLALLLHLLTEEKPELQCTQIIKNRNAALMWIVPFVLLGIDSYFLHTGVLDQATYIAQTAAILALLLGVCFLPFRKERDDRMSWNFVFRLAVAWCIAFGVGLVMFMGLLLLYNGSSELFGFRQEEKMQRIIALICLLTLPALLFLIRIPEGEDMHSTRIPRSRFLLGITRYLFIPLALLYMAVLYVYGLKILFTMTLPKGTLSMLVSTLMFGIIGITFILYPYLRDENHKGYEVRLIRIMPLLVLPLLMLMSVGIGRRFIDYGITDKRLYLLTLNIWFYVVALGLWFMKVRRIHWVSISFALLLVLTSCHPWNYNSIYRNMLFSRIDALTAKYDLKLKGFTSDTLKRILNAMPETDAKLLYSTLEDIYDYDYGLYRKSFGDDVYLSYEKFMGTDRKANDKPFTMYYKYAHKGVNVLDGYKYVNYIMTGLAYLYTDSVTEEIEDDYGIMCNDSTFIYCNDDFGRITIRHKGLDDNKPLVVDVPGHDAKLVISYLSIRDDEAGHKNMQFDLEGYIFYNK